MDILVVPLNKDTKPKFFDLLIKEEYKKQLFWLTDIKHNLKINSYVFFPEVFKVVRLYKVTEFNNNYLILSKSIADILWKDWAYVVNNKKDSLPEKEYIIPEEKTKHIYNIFSCKNL